MRFKPSSRMIALLVPAALAAFVVSGCSTVPRQTGTVTLRSSAIGVPDGTPYEVRLQGPGGVRNIGGVIDNDSGILLPIGLAKGKWTVDAIAAPASDTPWFGHAGFTVGGGGSTVTMDMTQRPYVYPRTSLTVSIGTGAEGVSKAFVRVGRGGTAYRSVVIDLSKKDSFYMDHIIPGRYTAMVEYMDSEGKVVYVPKVQAVIATEWGGNGLSFGMDPQLPPIKGARLPAPVIRRADFDPVSKMARVSWEQAEPFETAVSAFYVELDRAKPDLTTTHGPFPPGTNAVDIQCSNPGAVIKVRMIDERGRSVDSGPQTVTDFS